MTNEPVQEVADQTMPYRQPDPVALPHAAVAPAAVAGALPSLATQHGLAMLGVASGAGLAGDWLLRATPWGINFFLWLSLTGGAAWMIVRQHSPAHRVPRWLVYPLGFFALALAWRDSATLQALDLFAWLVCLMLLCLQTQRGKLLTAGLIDYVTTACTLVAQFIMGALMLVFGDIRWRELPRDGWSRHAFAVAKGVALAVPLLLLFGGLLMAADAVFENLVVRTFDFDLASIFGHLFAAGGIAWLVAGYLHGALSPSSMLASPNPTSQPQPAKGLLGLIETGIVLGALNLLFLTFVIIQFRYLFFGAVNFPAGSGTPYALYARRGFFELVWVSVLVLPLLLSLHWALRKDEPRNERVFRWLAGTQIALLFIIMASAVQRMRLYQICCGLTELRIYTMAFMGWLALVFLWFVNTVLRGRRERFAFGATIAGLCVIAALHFLNPDYLIARVNLARATEGLSLDAKYTTSLSADSVPALVAGLPNLLPSQQAEVRERMLARDWSGGARGWRSWNWSRVRAYKHVIALERVQ
jgi:hypothetical protein